MLSLDGKGRLTVPARWLPVLTSAYQGQLIVAKQPERCLGLYPLPVWDAFEKQLLDLSSEYAAWRRLYIGSATEVDIDSGSRVLIPPELRAWAGLEKDVKFMGVGPHFELWDLARYESRETDTVDGGMPEAIKKLVVR